jgi:hypothetical protein
MSQDRFQGLSDIGFDDFRSMAPDDSLSHYQKIGFPDEYRGPGCLNKLDRSM